eukprot:TRINITY_DN11328_c0_g2_i1.p1 TRINITY_DN11328_c0_g2~~TRINITY_DN11328_c0_g2_i1.p1  ORF type:complete len:515 (+),score=178.45 TRINITY_DN11328_c0_g2_i1:83-1627(+)
MLRAAALAAALHVAAAQQVGTQTAERHPQLSVQQCTKASGCSQQQKSVTIDANWRWTHKVGSTQNCYTGNVWDPSLCPDAQTCSANCAIEGADSEYASTYGVRASGNDLSLGFVTQGPYSKNVGARTYLLDDESTYKVFKLKNREFTFDVDVSNMPCGLNGALYFVEMDADGGMSKYPGNKAGAKYGTGYCDAQCPHDIKFINGEANSEGWKPSASDPNSGVGKYGTCCTEMDIWESNKFATAYTAHSCTGQGQTRCSGVQCGDDPDHRFDGMCDKNGCDIQPFRLGHQGFFGPGANYTVDSTRPVAVVTQFITADGSDSGALKEIRRLYVQGGKVIQSPDAKVGSASYSSISTDYCKAETAAFQDNTTFIQRGGLKAMGDALDRGMVLVMSLWDDHAANMLWLDSDYPTTKPASTPGVHRGPCPPSSGKPSDVESQYPGSSVTFSNIKFGEIGSTYSGSPAPAPGPGPAPTPPTPPSPSSCPGGSLQACMDLCPTSPPAAFKACVQVCSEKCA